MKAMVTATEATQVLGTLAAVYGRFITAIGWSNPRLVWAYALVWFFINSGCKIVAYRVYAHRGPRQVAHRARAENWLVSHVRGHR